MEDNNTTICQNYNNININRYFNFLFSCYLFACPTYFFDDKCNSYINLYFKTREKLLCVCENSH